MSWTTKLVVLVCSLIPWGFFVLVRSLTDDKLVGAATLATGFLVITPLLVMAAAAYGYMEGRASNIVNRGE